MASRPNTTLPSSCFTTSWPTSATAARRRPKVGAKIRIGVVSPYIVIYKHTETDGVVRVLRIVHGSRWITGKLIRGAP